MLPRGLLYLRLKSMRIAISYGFHGISPLLIPLLITAVTAIAVGAASHPQSKAVTVEFETL